MADLVVLGRVGTPLISIFQRAQEQPNPPSIHGVTAQNLSIDDQYTVKGSVPVLFRQHGTRLCGLEAFSHFSVQEGTGPVLFLSVVEI